MIYKLHGGPWDGWEFEPLRRAEAAIEYWGPQQMSGLLKGYTFALDGNATWNGDDGE